MKTQKLYCFDKVGKITEDTYNLLCMAMQKALIRQAKMAGRSGDARRVAYGAPLLPNVHGQQQ